MKILSCKFNIDTACVELKIADGTMISINCTVWRTRSKTICISVLNWII